MVYIGIARLVKLAGYNLKILNALINYSTILLE